MTAPSVRPVLVVEDSDEDFDTVVEALHKARLPNQVVRATTGDECVQLLRGPDPAALRPAVVLLDLNTPGLDGRDALAEIRAAAELGRLPVIVLSTSANPRDVAHCYRLGANAYHVKPIRYGEHIRLVEDLLTYWLQRVVLPRELE